MVPNERTGPSWWAFPAFLGSVFSSGLADGAFKVIVPLLAITMTRSPEAIGIAAAMVWLPWPLLALFVGDAADRGTPVRVMWLGEITRVVLVLLLVVLALTGAMNTWIFALFVFLVGTASVTVDVPAQAVIPRIVDPVGLVRANGRIQLVQLSTVQLVGPPIAGYLVALGVSGSLGLLSISFLVSALLLALTMKGLGSSPGDAYQDNRARESVLVSLKAGMSYIAKRADVVRMSALAGVSNFAFSGIAATLPVFAVAPGPLGLSSTEYGILFASGAVGGVIIGFASHSLVTGATGEHAYFLILAVAVSVTGVLFSPRSQHFRAPQLS